MIKTIYFNTIKSKSTAMLELMKLRLTSLVVLSSIVGYLFGTGFNFSLINILTFTLGGFLIIISSNAINQLIERDTDKLMDRTKDRPIPTDRLESFEVILFIGFTAIFGTIILSVFFNALTGILSIVSLFLYGFVYTPLKKLTSFAVFLGAIPGALPPLLGYTAATGVIDGIGVWIFTVQFFWQFPHFWAIAWNSFEDYSKASIMLLPSKEGRTKASSFIILVYTLALIPVCLTPLLFNFGISYLAIIINVLSSIVFTYFAFLLFKNNDQKSAKGLMFYSFAYLLIFLGTLFI